MFFKICQDQSNLWTSQKPVFPNKMDRNMKKQKSHIFSHTEQEDEK